jgi:ATP-dependent exoDNAse (exonuclease V) alpha subunit
MNYKYFPLQLAYAMTIHKGQGQTAKYAVMNICDCHQSHMPYVALSRVKTLSGLILLEVPSLKDLNKFSASSDSTLLLEELEREEQLQLRTLEEIGLLSSDIENCRKLGDKNVR